MVLEKGVLRRQKKEGFVSAKFLQYSSKSQPRFKKKNEKMTTKSIVSGTSPHIQKKSGSSRPQLRSCPSKIGCLKEDNFEGQKDNIGKKLNQNKIDVSKDWKGYGYSSGRYDVKDNISPCLTLLENNHSFHPGSNSKEVPKDERKLGKGLLENFKKLCDIQRVISHLFIIPLDFANHNDMWLSNCIVGEVTCIHNIHQKKQGAL